MGNSTDMPMGGALDKLNGHKTKWHDNEKLTGRRRGLVGSRGDLSVGHGECDQSIVYGCMKMS